MSAGTPVGDVWLRFEHEEDEDASHEANTFKTEHGFQIQHCHTAVGQITKVDFDTLEEVHAWYERQGFLDFSS